jgi:LysR family glycine cleavage system transcriptional activator
MHGQRVPPLNAVRAFHAAALRLNFRLASEDLGVTQSAVAQQVRRLEAHLNARLFERRPRGLDLTSAGESFFGAVDRALRLIGEAATRASHAAEILTLSAPPTFMSRWLVPRLHKFMSAHPGIEARLSASERLVDFSRDGVDVAVRFGYGRYPGLASALLFGLEPVPVCSPGLLSRVGKISVDDVGSTVPALHDAHRLWSLWAEQQGRRRLETERGVEFSHTQHALEAALLGQGCALVPRRFVESELEDGRLVQPFAIEIVIDIGFYVVAPERTWNTRKILELRQWIAAEAGTARASC